MKKEYWIVILLIALAGCLTSCSGGNGKGLEPVAAGSDPEGISVIGDEQEVFGSWHCVIDPDTMKVDITENRELANFNFTNYMSWCNGGCYQLTINYIEDSVIHLQSKLTNPVNISPFDVRIIFANLDGKEVIDPDGYTNLFDPPGGTPINPFYYYYITSDPDRHFPPGPGNSLYKNFNVNITGSTSWEFDIIGTCGFSHIKDVVEMTSFATSGTLTSSGGSMHVEAAFLDWQDDITEVKLFAEELEGMQINMIYNPGISKWECDLHNSEGVEAGVYKMFIYAYSPNNNLAAYLQNVEIVVSHEPSEEQFSIYKSPYYKNTIMWTDFEGKPYEYSTEINSGFIYLCENKDYAYSMSLNYIWGRANYIHQIGGFTRTIMILGFFGGACDDGSKAVYEWNSRIWIAQSYGTGISTLASASNEYSPCISSDGSRIAYISYDMGEPDLAYREFADINTEFFTMPGNGMNESEPVLTSDGSRVFLSAKLYAESAFDIYMYMLPMGLIQPVIITADIEEKNIQISHDGSMMVFLRESAVDSNRFNVYVYRENLIPHELAITSDAGGNIDYQYPDINSSGTMILYNRYDFGVPSAQLYLNNAEGTDARLLATQNLSYPMTFNAY